MGERIIKKDNNFDKLQILKESMSKEEIKDGDILRVDIKSDNKKLNLSSYLKVISKGQISITKYGRVEIEKHYELYSSDNIRCIYSKQNFDEDFIDYYKKFKELAYKHKELGFGNSPRLAEGFTESLCRYIRKLYKVKGREYDAIDNKGNNVEIKATTSKSGTVTINSDVEFDYLLWMYFDLDNDELLIYKLNYDSFKSRFDTTSGRITVNLSSFNEIKKEQKFKLIGNKIKEIKLK